jgi:NADPH-dependent 2,4-dienoyl-CoA reductase/sulfur reductase-like enzyme
MRLYASETIHENIKTRASREMCECGTDSVEIRARCCVAGGGPAGMVLGLLLARAGVEVVVLEKHVDFLRDFRATPFIPRRWR